MIASEVVPTPPFELTAEERALLPTAEDMASYRERGFFIPRGRLFTDAELERAVAGQERYYRGERDRPLPPGVDAMNWQAGAPGLRKSDYACLQNRELFSIVSKPILAAIAARLIGATEIRLWHDQLLFKPPAIPGAPSRIGWHTDHSYWRTCSAREMITAWVPFHDVDVSLGAMWMIEGSQAWPEQSYDFFDHDLDGRESRFETAGKSIRKVPIELRKGQVSFHGWRTVHGSGDNVSDRPRRALAVHLQPGENRFQRTTNEHGVEAWHPNDYLVRRDGELPDYADPEICPVLYRE